MYTKKKGPMFRRREKKKEISEEEAKAGASGEQKVTSAFLRMQSDMADLDVPPNCTLNKKGNDLSHFSVIIHVNDGKFWDGGQYEFDFVVPTKYPFEGPKVTCVDKIYHPNIDLQGAVCVSVLRPWKPTYSIQTVIFALLFLFSHANPKDPLNNEAAAAMREDIGKFAQNVKKAMQGGTVDGERFPKNKGLLKKK